MNAQLSMLPTDRGPAYIRQGGVVRCDDNGGCLVLINDGDREQQVYAQPAMGTAAAIAAGDTVVVAGESRSAGFIIGVTSAVASGGPSSRQVVTDTGAMARIVPDGQQGEQIEVQSPTGQTVFTYDGRSGSITITNATGDLKLLAPNGNIDLISGGRVRMQHQTPAGDQSPGRVQSLALDQTGLDLAVRRMRLSAARGEWAVGRGIYRGQQFDANVDRARMVYGRLETVARVLWERIDEGCRQVRDLYQIKAGRLRTLVQGALHMKSKRTDILAQEAVRIDAEKIHLG